MQTQRRAWVILLVLLVLWPEPQGHAANAAPRAGRARGGPPIDTLLLYFGYASCPEVCPTTLAALAETYRRHGRARRQRRLSVAFVNLQAPGSANAARDFARGFHPAFRGLERDEFATLGIQDRIDVFYSESMPIGGEPLHSDAIYLLERELLGWRLRATYSEYPPDPQALLALLTEPQPPARVGAGS